MTLRPLQTRRFFIWGEYHVLRSCKYCGRIHDRRHDCGRKPKYKKRFTNIDGFRSTAAWQKKREQIRQRDMNLCQICIRNLYGTIQQYTYDGLSVHHAEPVEQAWNKRLDDDNLLLVCDMHHEMAEAGEIPLDEIQRIISEQQSPPGRLGRNY